MEFEGMEQEDKALVAGLRHVTFSCVHARMHDVFWTKILGLRRVKQTVDYDCPDIYHLYYGNEIGAPGTIVSSLILPDNLAGGAARQKNRNFRAAGQHKAVFAAPAGALPFWQKRLRDFEIKYELKTVFGQTHIVFSGPGGEELELTETAHEKRRGWPAVIAVDKAICGLHSLSLAVHDKQAAANLLLLLGYRKEGEAGGLTRFVLPNGNGANIVDLEQGKPAKAISDTYLRPGAIAHFAFALAPEQDLAQLREFLLDKGYNIGGVADNVYFSYFYLHAPQKGPLVGIATSGPGFEKDERKNSLGASLQLPKSHEHLRQFITSHLESLLA